MDNGGHKDIPEAEISTIITNLRTMRQGLAEASDSLWDSAADFVTASTDPDAIQEVSLARVDQDRERVLDETARGVSRVSRVVNIIDEGLREIDDIENEADSASQEEKKARKIAKVSAIVEALRGII